MDKKKRVKFVNREKTQFLKTLKQRIDQYFLIHQIERQANKKMVVKSIVLLCLYLMPLCSLYIFYLPDWAVIGCFMISGFGLAGVGMSVMHDANHGSYSCNKYVNSLLGGTLNILGGYDVNWRLQHNILHHTYTNITNVDEDIEQRLKMRWSPFSKWYPVQRFQHIYAFMAYFISTLNWVIIKDYKQYFTYYNNGVNKIPKSQYYWGLFKLIFFKVFYILYLTVIPVWFLGYDGGLILGGFLCMHVIGGFILSTIFQLAHVVEEVEFPMPNEKGEMENEWAIHQLLTTANFAHNNKMLTWYAGGLTHQIEHHLFPDICHIHYPGLAPIVQQTAQEFSIPYNYYPSYFAALSSHVKTLKKFGLQSDFDLANS